MSAIDESVIDFYTVLYNGGIIEDGIRIYTDGCIYSYNRGAVYKIIGKLAMLLKEFD